MSWQRCSGNFYDTSKEYVDVLYVVWIVMYAVAELALLLSIIQAMRKYNMHRNKGLLLFYISLNIIFIVRILHLLGGLVICYPKHFYNTIMTFTPWVIKDIAYFLYLHRVSTYLEELDLDSSKLYHAISLGIQIVIVMNCLATYLLSFLKEYINSDAVLYFSCAVYVCTSAVLVFLCLRMYSFVNAHAKRLDSKEGRFLRQWVLMNILLLLLLIFKAVHLIVQVVSDAIENMNSISHVIYIFFYGTLTELVPVGTIGLFIFCQLRHSTDLSSSEYTQSNP